VDGVCLKQLFPLLTNVIKIVIWDLANALNLFVQLTTGLPDQNHLVMMLCKEAVELVLLFLSLMVDTTAALLQPMEDLTDILLTEFGGSRIFTILGQMNMLHLWILFL
jgi:hypothetical protein